MKLHNLLLTAALFLTAGIASADSISEGDYNAPQFIKNTTVPGAWTTSGNNSLDIILMYKNGTADTLSGYAYYVVAHKTGAEGWDVLSGLALSEPAANGRLLSTDESAQYTSLFSDIGGHSTPNVYEFKVAFDEKVYDQIGILGRNGSPSQIVNSAENDPATNGSQFHYNTPHSVLYFQNGGDIKAALLIDATYIGSNTTPNGGDETMGAPLPAPVVTLLIALGFGAALVMYRNRKQENA